MHHSVVSQKSWKCWAWQLKVEGLMKFFIFPEKKNQLATTLIYILQQYIIYNVAFSHAKFCVNKNDKSNGISL